MHAGCEAAGILGGMMKKKKELCQHCGASMMMNAAILSKHALRCLVKAARHQGAWETKQLNLTKTEYPNVTKLKYWGFIRAVGRKRWEVTTQGLAFLRGETSAPSRIMYFRDRVIRRDPDIHVWDIVDETESREKYIAMMTPVLGEIQPKLQFDLTGLRP